MNNQLKLKKLEDILEMATRVAIDLDDDPLFEDLRDAYWAIRALQELKQENKERAVYNIIEWLELDQAEPSNKIIVRIGDVELLETETITVETLAEALKNKENEILSFAYKTLANLMTSAIYQRDQTNGELKHLKEEIEKVKKHVMKTACKQ